MQYDHFVQQVQHRARLSSNGGAVSAIRATLETLAERLAGGEAGDLAAQLPRELGLYVERADGQGHSFSIDEFFQRVSEREPADLQVAIHHAKAVISVLEEAVSGGEMDDVRAQLPPEFNQRFEYAEADIQ